MHDQVSVPPRISVIMAAHNAAETIAESIKSIQGQTLTDWELLIVDDASSDSTVGVVADYADDRRIVLIESQDNVGPGKARNLAIKLARAEFIAILDADDIALPRRLEAQVAQLVDDDELVVVGSAVSEFGSWGGPEVRQWPTSSTYIAQRLARGKWLSRTALVQCERARCLRWVVTMSTVYALRTSP